MARSSTIRILVLLGTAGAGLAVALIVPDSRSWLTGPFRGWLFGPPDTLVTLIGSTLVAVGLLATARQWQADNQAKRDEARSRRHQEHAERRAAFRTWQTNAAVMMILNYERDVVIREDHSPEKVSWETCELALIPAPYRRYLYEPTLIAIRDCFNDWLENISTLIVQRDAGLVTQEDVDHLCKTLLLRVANQTNFASGRFARNLRLYIQWRGADRVIGLIKHYGCDITSMWIADDASLLADIQQGRYGECHPSSW